MAVLTGMEASVRSVGQGHPATFYGPFLQTLTINTLYNFLIQSKGPVLLIMSQSVINLKI